MALYAIGEALIDFVPSRPGKPDADIRYTPAVGGRRYPLPETQPRGENGTRLRHPARQRRARVRLLPRPVRRYALPTGNLAAITPQPGDILHYCSVSLTPGPMRDAHRAAIERFRAAGALISFDINLRLPLWPNPTDLHAAVQEYLPLADILKISDDELEFVTGERDPARGVGQLQRGAVKHVIYTCGADGAAWYDASGQRGAVDAYPVQAVDATGAGDAFIGGLLAEMSRRNLNLQQALTDEHIAALLRHAAAVGAITTLQRGAINSMPDREQLHAFHAQNAQGSASTPTHR